MIDFPASPTDGQIFSATNGVVYKYSTAYSSWLAQNPAPPLGGTGQVTAASSSAQSGMAASTDVQIAFGTVQAGNAGLWWNTSTNRYTPPAGSYFLQCNSNVFAPSGGNGSAALKLRKNGAIVNTITGSGSASFAVPISLGEYVDANGSDYFDWVINCNTVGQSLGAVFTAFPLTGMQGPTGGAPGPVVGDFCAVGTPALAVGSFGTLVPTNIVSGNSGAYYNTTTGRYTPPAGRYRLFVTFSGSCSGAATNFYGILRKNGVEITRGVGTGSNTGNSCNCTAEATVDANGSDFFDCQGQSTAASPTLAGMTFSAFPTQGMVGPQGPTGPPGYAVVGLDPGNGTTWLAGDKVISVGGWTDIVSTPSIGAAGQKWRITTFMLASNSPTGWTYGRIFLSSGGVSSGLTQLAQSSNYNDTAGAGDMGMMDFIETLTGPSVFVLQANSNVATGTIRGNRQTAITAMRIS